MTKTGADGTSITQSFGFYPNQFSGLDLITNFPAVIKDNGGQEYNASLTMYLTPERFAQAMQTALALSPKAYNVQTYNCADYAVDVYNSVSLIPLQVQELTFYMAGALPPSPPTGNAIAVTFKRSPQKLFQAIDFTRRAYFLGEPYLTIDQTHGHKAPLSHGECN